MKRQNIIFLIFFILLTFLPVPVFFLFREQIGYKNTENKAENPFPDLNSENYSTWPTRFEEWFSDNLPFKTQFIELFRGAQLRSGLDFTQSNVIRGKDDFLFYRKTIENYKGLTRFTDEELSKIEANLTSFFNEMDAKGTKCLLYIAPDKEQVYPEKMPENIRRVSTQSRGDQLAEYLKNRVDFPVLYPKNELHAISRQKPVYFNADTHWNFLGGWVANQQIKAAFEGKGIEYNFSYQETGKSKGMDLAGMLGLEDQLHEKNDVEIHFSDEIAIRRTEMIENGKVQRYITEGFSEENNKKLLIVGDSFSEYFLHSAGHDVEDILFITYGNLFRINLEREKPDYLVVMLVERNLPFLLEGFF